MDILQDEVRTLPPLVSGGFNQNLPPAGAAPVPRTITGFPSESVDPSMQNGHQYARNSLAKSKSKQIAADRKEAVKRVVNSHYLDHTKSLEMSNDVAMQVIFQDTNVISLLQSGVINRGIDLGPALMHTPALLTKHVDPNASRTSRLIAGAKLGRMSKRAFSSEDRLAAGPGSLPYDSASLKLDPASSLNRADHNPTSKQLQYQNEQQKIDPSEKLKTNKNGKVGVVNMSSGTVLPKEAKKKSLEKRGGQENALRRRSSMKLNRSNSVATMNSRKSATSREGGFKLSSQPQGLEESEDDSIVWSLSEPSTNPDAVDVNNQQSLFDILKSEVERLPSYKMFHQKYGSPNATTVTSCDPEVQALDFSVSVIRSYLALLAQYSQQHFLIYLGRTLKETADFRAYQRAHSSNWAMLDQSFHRLELVLKRYGAPLAIVDGARLAQVSNSGIASVSMFDLLNCLENLDQVGPILALPGKLPPLGETRREVRMGAAIIMQALARGYLARGAYEVRLIKGRAAIVIQKEVRLRQALLNYTERIWKKRQEDKKTDQRLRNRLAAQWCAAGGEPVGRVEVHLPSVTVLENVRLLLRGAPHCQLHDSFLWLSALRDKNISHLVLVSPIEIPEDVLLHWSKMISMMTGDDSTVSLNRFTVVIPEASAHFSSHLPLAAVLRYSPVATNRIARIVKRHASQYDGDLQAYLIPSKMGKEEEILSRKLDLPILAANAETCKVLGTKSGAKLCLSRSGCHVPIGAHDIVDQADLVVALAKLIASNMDIEEWVLRANVDHDMVGVAMLKAADLTAVHELRQERHDMIENHHGNKRVWLKPDVQLVARSRLLSDLREKLPKVVVLARPRVFPDGWIGFVRHFLRCRGVIEAMPPKKCLEGRVAAHLFLAPDACKHGDGLSDIPERQRRSIEDDAVLVMSTQELLTTPLAETVAVVFPQRCVPPEALIGAARAVGRELLSSGCLGRVSVSFAVFKDAKSKKMLMWAEEVNLFPTPQAAFHECLSALASIPAKPLPPADPLGTLGPAPIATYPREGNSPHKSLSNSSFQQHQALVSLNRDDSFLLTFDDSSEDNNSQGQDIQFHNYETFLELNEMSLSKVNGQPLNPVPSTNVSSTGVSPLPSIHSSPRFQLGTSKAGSFKEMAALEHAISLGVTTSSSTPKGMSYVACCPLYHPGLPTVLPLAKLLRLARLKNHGYDIRTAKGDLFIPVDSLAGGVIATASVTTQGDEAVAALKFSHLLEFFASRVGRRTVLGQHEANLHSNGDDGFDRFVALQVAVEGALARFEARRQRANV